MLRAKLIISFKCLKSYILFGEELPLMLYKYKKKCNMYVTGKENKFPSFLGVGNYTQVLRSYMLFLITLRSI